jgi:hypothetical protein
MGDPEVSYCCRNEKIKETPKEESGVSFLLSLTSFYLSSIPLRLLPVAPSDPGKSRTLLRRLH